MTISILPPKKLFGKLCYGLRYFFKFKLLEHAVELRLNLIVAKIANTTYMCMVQWFIPMKFTFKHQMTHLFVSIAEWHALHHHFV